MGSRAAPDGIQRTADGPATSRVRAPVAHPTAGRPARVAGRLWVLLLSIVALSVAVIGFGIGLDYYTLPFPERPFSDFYDDLRPAGRLGLRYGIVGFAFITAGVILYSGRKRIRALARLGKLKFWLEFHIFLCTVGPFLVTLHTSFKVGGLVSIAFWCMVVVALSGIFGRYVYVRIPKTMQGSFADLTEIRAQRAGLIEELTAGLGPRVAQVERLLPPAVASPREGLLAAVASAVRFDLTHGATLRKVRRELAAAPLTAPQRARVLRLVERQLEVEHQLAHLQPFQRLFRYWHILHLPLAIVMFIVVAVHITVATLFGFGFT